MDKIKQFLLNKTLWPVFALGVAVLLYVINTFIPIVFIIVLLSFAGLVYLYFKDPGFHTWVKDEISKFKNK